MWLWMSVGLASWFVQQTSWQTKYIYTPDMQLYPILGVRCIVTARLGCCILHRTKLRTSLPSKGGATYNQALMPETV
jgi:hypothetical protein